jgi:hypothetical protein
MINQEEILKLAVPFTYSYKDSLTGRTLKAVPLCDLMEVINAVREKELLLANTPVDIEAERKLFETRQLSIGASISKNNDGKYFSDSIQGAWLGWQARAQLSNQSLSADTIEDVDKYLSNMVSESAEPIRALGEKLANKLDEDDFNEIESYLIKAAILNPALSADKLDAGIVDLLKEARQSLFNGLETDGNLEAEHSIADKDLISRIDQAINNKG